MARSRVLDMQLGRANNALENATESNAKKKANQDKIAEISTIIERATKLYTLQTKVLKELTIYAANYRKRRKTELEEETKRVLSLVFPDEGFDIKIDWTEARGKAQAQILTGLKDENGETKWAPPKNVHGEFAKQLIAYTTLVNMTIMLGAEFFCSDEALNSGDDISLTEVKPLLNKLSESLQLIAIEHKKSFYEGINHREIILEKVHDNLPGVDDKFKGHVKVLSMEDVIVDESLLPGAVEGQIEGEDKEFDSPVSVLGSFEQNLPSGDNDIESDFIESEESEESEE